MPSCGRRSRRSTGTTARWRSSRTTRTTSVGFERFGYLAERNDRFRRLWTGLLQEAVDAGELRADLDVELVYRFLRDTVWVAVAWYRPGGALSADEVAAQYLSILLEGIADHA